MTSSGAGVIFFPCRANKITTVNSSPYSSRRTVGSAVTSGLGGWGLPRLGWGSRCGLVVRGW